MIYNAHLLSEKISKIEFCKAKLSYNKATYIEHNLLRSNGSDVKGVMQKSAVNGFCFFNKLRSGEEKPPLICIHLFEIERAV